MTSFIPAPIKPEITMDHLEKIDIRVGAIERVELVPASNKLVKLTVDFGDRRRTVVAGLRAERTNPQAEIEGRQSPGALAGGRDLRGDAVRHRLRRWPYPGARDTGKAAAKWRQSGMNPAFDQRN